MVRTEVNIDINKKKWEKNMLMHYISMAKSFFCVRGTQVEPKIKGLTDQKDVHSFICSYCICMSVTLLCCFFFFFPNLPL